MTNLINKFFDKKSFKSIMILAWPLILATFSNVIQQCVDKIFLGQYSQEALAACVPAGMLSSVIICFCTGTIIYVSNFIAQFRGAEEYDKIAVILNQGFILSVIFGFICFIFSFSGNFLFETIAKHDADLVALELAYFRPTLIYAVVTMFGCCILSFFIGIEKIHVILYAIIILTITNTILDYILIFGKFGFREMGIAGAAYATIIAYSLGSLFLAFILFSHKYNKIYKTRTKIRFDFKIFRKLIRYGMPSGIQATMNFIIWTIFIMIIGKFTVAELAASNIVLQLDQVGIMPVLGMGCAVSILIANELGKEEKKSLNMLIRTAVFLTTVYNFIVVLFFILFPRLLILPFTDITNPNEELIRIAVTLLKILSVYVVFDGCVNILLSVLKGAGDTVFIMWTMFISGIIFIICPAFIALKINNLYFAWWGACSYIIVLFMIFMIRVKQGEWKKIKIIA